MRIYLDNGILASFEKGELNLDDILAVLGRNRHNVYFPFTAAHIQEANNITHPKEEERQKFLQTRLNLIRDISDGMYLNFDMREGEVLEMVKEPMQVLETITEVPSTDNLIKSVVNLFSKELKDQFRSSLGIDPRELNNYNPKDIVGHLNIKLASLGYQSFLDLIEGGISNYTSIMGHRFVFGEKFAILFELLDLFGYWKDKHTNTSNFARLWDSNHATYASYCDYFISNDFRTRKKAQVAYGLFGINTKALSSSGDE